MAESNYPEVLMDLCDQVAQQLVGAGLDVEKAAEIGFATSEYIREHWGGHPIYIVKGLQYECSRRDVEIFEKFNGHNHATLAREYNLSVMRIYQIVKAVRAELFRKRQGALF